MFAISGFTAVVQGLSRDAERPGESVSSKAQNGPAGRKRGLERGEERIWLVADSARMTYWSILEMIWSSDPIVSIRNVTKVYRQEIEVAALVDVSLDIASGSGSQPGQGHLADQGADRHPDR
jgi:hypothetical protein